MVALKLVIEKSRVNAVKLKKQISSRDIGRV